MYVILRIDHSEDKKDFHPKDRTTALFICEDNPSNGSIRPRAVIDALDTMVVEWGVPYRHKMLRIDIDVKSLEKTRDVFFVVRFVHGEPNKIIAVDDNGLSWPMHQIEGIINDEIKNKYLSVQDGVCYGTMKYVHDAYKYTI